MQATLLGSLAVLIWGIALPVSRIIQSQIGRYATIGLLSLVAGLAGLAYYYLKNRKIPGKGYFKNPYLYARWSCFVIHISMIVTAIGLVSKENVPFVILLNYLWPSATILASVLIAGVKIIRPAFFIAGTLIVLASLAFEILGPAGFSSRLFQNGEDLLSYLMAIVAALAWSLYSALSRRAGEASGGGAVIPYFQLTLALALPYSFIDRPLATWTLDTYGSVLVAIYCSMQFLAYLFWDYGMRQGSVVLLSLFADFIPWISLTAAALFLGVEIEFKTVLSVIAMVLGAMITRYGTLNKMAKSS